MRYPVRTEFFKATETENDYSEIVKSYDPLVVIGCRPNIVSFKDSMQGGISLDGERQYLYSRKTTETMKVEVGDQVTMPSVSDKTYEVIAIDPMLTNRSEIMFLIDGLES
jgi:hypothetical protein